MTEKTKTPLLKSREFWVRTASGIVLAIILVAVFVIGYDVLFVFMCILSLLGLYELYKALNLGFNVLSITGYLTIIAHYILVRFELYQYLMLLYSVSLIIILAAFVFTFPKYSLAQLFVSFFGIFYVGVSLFFVYILRIHPPSGAYLVWLIVFSTWGCDIFAYLTGMLFGKHKLVPNLSPKKSVEGAIGGVVGAMVLSAVYGFIVQPYVTDIKLAPLVFAVVNLFGAVAGQIGDLAASAIKRKVGIKDYGHLIPGHGGILDRFDSMIIVAPIIYIVAIYAIMMR